MRPRARSEERINPAALVVDAASSANPTGYVKSLPPVAQSEMAWALVQTQRASVPLTKSEFAVARIIIDNIDDLDVVGGGRKVTPDAVVRRLERRIKVTERERTKSTWRSDTPVDVYDTYNALLADSGSDIVRSMAQRNADSVHTVGAFVAAAAKARGTDATRKERVVVDELRDITAGGASSIAAHVSEYMAGVIAYDVVSHPGQFATIVKAMNDSGVLGGAVREFIDNAQLRRQVLGYAGEVDETAETYARYLIDEIAAPVSAGAAAAPLPPLDVSGIHVPFFGNVGKLTGAQMDTIVHFLKHNTCTSMEKPGDASRNAVIKLIRNLGPNNVERVLSMVRAVRVTDAPLARKMQGNFSRIRPDAKVVVGSGIHIPLVGNVGTLSARQMDSIMVALMKESDVLAMDTDMVRLIRTLGQNNIMRVITAVEDSVAIKNTEIKEKMLEKLIVVLQDRPHTMHLVAGRLAKIKARHVDASEAWSGSYGHDKNALTRVIREVVAGDTWSDDLIDTLSSATPAFAYNVLYNIARLDVPERRKTAMISSMFMAIPRNIAAYVAAISKLPADVQATVINAVPYAQLSRAMVQTAAGARAVA